MMDRTSVARYEAAVTTALQKTYGITWQDACGDVEPLELALADGLAAAEFVGMWGERYDLEPLQSDPSVRSGCA